VGGDDLEYGGKGTEGRPGACTGLMHTESVCKLAREAKDDVRLISLEKGASKHIFNIYFRVTNQANSRRRRVTKLTNLKIRAAFKNDFEILDAPRPPIAFELG